MAPRLGVKSDLLYPQWLYGSHMSAICAMRVITKRLFISRLYILPEGFYWITCGYYWTCYGSKIGGKIRFTLSPVVIWQPHVRHMRNACDNQTAVHITLVYLARRVLLDYVWLLLDLLWIQDWW